MTHALRKEIGDNAERAVAGMWIARRWPFVRHAFPDSVLDRLRAKAPDVHAEVRHRPDFIITTAATFGLVYADVKSSLWVESRELEAHALLAVTTPVLYVVPRGDDPHRWCVFWHPGSVAGLTYEPAKSEAASGDVGWTPDRLLLFDDYWPNGGASR